MRFLTTAIWAAALAFAPLSAAAVSYQSVILFTPQGDPTDGLGPTSTDEADGNRIVLDFTTSLTTGVVFFDDLDYLSITLFGTNGFIYQDIAVVNGMATPLGGVPRDLAFDIDFVFDIDELENNRLVFFDNDFQLFASPQASGVTYNIFMNNNQFADEEDRFIDVVRYVDGVIDLDNSVVADGAEFFSVTTAAVPLPANVWLLLAGILAFPALRRVRGSTA